MNQINCFQQLEGLGLLFAQVVWVGFEVIWCCLVCVGDGQRADAAACAMSMFLLSATALRKLYLSRNLRGDLPSQTVGSDPACHICMGIKVCKLNIWCSRSHVY